MEQVKVGDNVWMLSLGQAIQFNVISIRTIGDKTFLFSNKSNNMEKRFCFKTLSDLLDHVENTAVYINGSN